MEKDIEYNITSFEFDIPSMSFRVSLQVRGEENADYIIWITPEGMLKCDEFNLIEKHN